MVAIVLFQGLYDSLGSSKRELDIFNEMYPLFYLFYYCEVILYSMDHQYSGVENSRLEERWKREN